MIELTNNKTVQYILNYIALFLYTLIITTIVIILIKGIKQKKSEKLSIRLSRLECKNKQYIRQNSIYIVKLKCSIFSKLNKLDNEEWLNIKLLLNNILVKTSKDLLIKFSPKTIYMHNNFIYMAFNNNIHIYDGSINKIITNIASYANMIFINKLNNVAYKYKNLIAEEMKNSMFSGNIIILKNYYDLCNYMLLKSKFETRRNYISTMSEHLYSPDILYKKNLDEQEKLINEKLNTYKKIDNYDMNILKNGVYIKKHIYNYDNSTESESLSTYKSTYKSDIITFLLPNIVCNKQYFDILNDAYYDSRNKH